MHSTNGIGHRRNRRRPLGTRLGLLVLTLTLVVLAGGPSAAQTAALSPAPAAAALPTLRLLTSTGPVETFDGETWGTLAPGVARSGAGRLRTANGAAAVALGGREPADGMLWLGPGTEIVVGRDKNGGPTVRVERGVVRLSLFEDDDPLLLDVARGGAVPDGVAPGGVAAGGLDLLVTCPAAGAPCRVTPTVERLEQAAWTLSLEGAPDPVGVGQLEAREVGGASGRPLTLQRLHVRAHRAGDLVVNEVEHVFANGSDARLEGTFRFPLPDGASVTGLAMEVDGRLMEGELVERTKARQTYESIVDAMRDPALLEWEQGTIFKLRVFPIEPHGTKRVVVRFLVPLREDADGWAYRYGVAPWGDAGDSVVASFGLEFEGVAVVADEALTGPRDVVVPLPRGTAPAAVLRETRADGVYTAVRIRPDWSGVQPQRPARGERRGFLILVDTSRSALESWDLARESVRAVLGQLRPSDRFLVVTTDIASRDHADGFRRATPGEVRAALRFLDDVEPDGASDLGQAIAHVGRIASDVSARVRVEVVYVGDGTATWGVTDTRTLLTGAAEQLPGVSFSAIALGRGASVPTLRALTGQQGGRLGRPHTSQQVRRLALAVTAPGGRRRLTSVQVRAAEGHDVYPTGATTLFEGDELVALVRTPAGASPPTTVVLEGVAAGRLVREDVACAGAAESSHVAHRWGAAHVAALEEGGAESEAVVAASLQYGVLSRQTAFLVLESEEAYRRHGIERRRGPQEPGDGDPAVTGGDLESLGAPDASLNPDDIQPGDPEVRIPAPEDARAVVVVFPFGETKVATWESALRAWSVRFLIDRDTPDGVYPVLVRITHADGAVELLRLQYRVDTHAPVVEVTLRPAARRGRGWIVEARQRIEDVEFERVLPAFRASARKDALRRRYASIVADVRRVEVETPDGRLLRLRPGRDGVFRATWAPEAPLGGPIALRVSAADAALNPRVFTVTVDPTADPSRGRGAEGCTSE